MQTKKMFGNQQQLLAKDQKLKLFVHSSQSLEENTDTQLIMELKIPNTNLFLKIIRNQESSNHWKLILEDTNKQKQKQIAKKITTKKVLILLDKLVERLEISNKNEPKFHRNLDKMANLLILIINQKIYRKTALNLK